MLRSLIVCCFTFLFGVTALGQEPESDTAKKAESSIDYETAHAVTFSYFDPSASSAAHSHVQLGVNVEKPTATLAKQLSLPAGIGLIVANVITGSAAETAKLESHDILLKFEDQWLVNEEQLRALIAMHEAGDTVSLIVIRASKELEVEAVLKASKKQVSLGEKLHFHQVDITKFDHAKMTKGLNCSACHTNANDLELQWKNSLEVFKKNQPQK